MPLWKCDVTGCLRPHVRKTGDCILCGRHLCAGHLQPAFHQCPTVEEDEAGWDAAYAAAMQSELDGLFARIDLAPLRLRASSLRGGIDCSTPELVHDSKRPFDMMGGMNYHVPVTFADGVVWIARIRRSNASSPPPPMRDALIMSEVATLCFLRGTKVPVPEVHDFALEGPDNKVGVGYILMDKVGGQPLQFMDLDAAQKEKVLDQFADIFIELRSHPFPSIGSLRTPGSSTVGECVAQTGGSIAADDTLEFLGPFSDASSYREATIRAQLEHIRNGEAYPNDLTNAYLIHRSMLDVVPSHYAHESKEFFLKHMDDKGDHIMVDDDMNIVSIIDWEFAQTTPISEAFAAPLFLIDIGDYYDNPHNDLSKDEELFARILKRKGAAELASFVRKGRAEHRLAHCIGGDFDDMSFPNLFRGYREAFIGKDSADLTFEQWLKGASQAYKNDEGFKHLPRLARWLKRV